jgi:hypothetical protein
LPPPASVLRRAAIRSALRRRTYPRCGIDARDLARDNTIRQSLAVVREAIELYSATYQKLPGADGNEAMFKADLAPLVGRFPKLTVGPPAAQDDSVAVDEKLNPVRGAHNPTVGWRYYYQTGVFIVNLRDPLVSDNSIEYDDL